MIEYKLVKFCVSCKDRFVVERAKKRTFYCNKCQKKIKGND